MQKACQDSLATQARWYKVVAEGLHFLGRRLEKSQKIVRNSAGTDEILDKEPNKHLTVEHQRITDSEIIKIVQKGQISADLKALQIESKMENASKLMVSSPLMHPIQFCHVMVPLM